MGIKNESIVLRINHHLKTKAQVVAEMRGLEYLTTLIEFKLVEEIQKWEDEFGEIKLEANGSDAPDTEKIDLIIEIRDLQRDGDYEQSSINNLMMKPYSDLVAKKSALIQLYKKDRKKRKPAEATHGATEDEMKKVQIDVNTTSIIKQKSEVVSKGRGVYKLSRWVEAKLTEEIKKWEKQYGVIDTDAVI